MALACPDLPSNTACIRIASSMKDCKQPSSCAESCTTLACKNAGMPGPLTAKASDTERRPTSCETLKPFATTLPRFTVKCCKMFFVVWTRPSSHSVGGFRNRCTMQDGQHSLQNWRIRLNVLDDSWWPWMLVELASVVRVANLIANGFRIASMFLASADWSPHETTEQRWKS